MNKTKNYKLLSKKRFTLIMFCALVISLAMSFLFASVTPLALANGESEITLIEAGAEGWSYNATATGIHSTNWTAVGYTEGDGWVTNKQAPLGFGTTTSSNYYSEIVTTVEKSTRAQYYFRKTFTINTATEVLDYVTGAVRYDDGAAVFLNGEYVFGINVPDAFLTTPADNQLATKTVNTGTPPTAEFPIPTGKFLNGQNVVAVVIFQDSTGSSDIFLDLEIKSFSYPTLDKYTSPNSVTMTFNGDVFTSRGFAWNNTFMLENPVIQIAKTSDIQGDAAVFFDGKIADPAVTVDAAITHRYSMHNFNKAVVSTLTADTEYTYRVGDKVYDADGDGKRDAFTAPATFKTGKNDNVVQFLHMTDPQGSISSGDSDRDFYYWANNIKNAVSHVNENGLGGNNSRVDFMAVTGDFVNTGTTMGQWYDCLEESRNTQRGATASETLRSNVIAPAAGNHEDSDYTFYSRFAVDNPEGSETSTGAYYSYEYGDALFIVLNTNEIPFNSANGKLSDMQIEWAENLLKNTAKKWKVVAMHKGLISTGSHFSDKDMPIIRNQLFPLFAKYEVDLVLQGHDHVYFRSEPYSYGKQMNGAYYTGNTVNADYTVDYVNVFGRENVQVTMGRAGTVYTTINTIGNKRYAVSNAVDYSWVSPGTSPINNSINNYQPEKSMFSDIRIEGDFLVLEAYTISNSNVSSGGLTLVDRYAVKKASIGYVEELIDALPSVNEITSEHYTDVFYAYSNFIGLSEDELGLLNPILKTKIEEINRVLGIALLKADFETAARVSAAFDAFLNSGAIDLTRKNEVAEIAALLASLNARQRSFVQNKDILINAESSIADLELAAIVIVKIRKTGNITLREITVLYDARMCYDALSANQKALVNNYDALVAKEAQFKAIEKALKDEQKTGKYTPPVIAGSFGGAGFGGTGTGGTMTIILIFNTIIIYLCAISVKKNKKTFAGFLS